LVIARVLDPSSELYIAEQWCPFGKCAACSWKVASTGRFGEISGPEFAA
jgi:hypothetical protein